jgi:hypothetical protein
MRVGVLQSCRAGGACEPLQRVGHRHDRPPLVRDDDVRIFQIDRLALEVASIPGETGDRPCPTRDLDGLGVPSSFTDLPWGLRNCARCSVRAGMPSRSNTTTMRCLPGLRIWCPVAGGARAALPRGPIPDQPSPCLSTHLPWHTRCMLVGLAEGASDGRRRPRLGAATGRRRRSGPVADGIGLSRAYRPPRCRAHRPECGTATPCPLQSGRPGPPRLSEP